MTVSGDLATSVAQKSLDSKFSLNLSESQRKLRYLTDKEARLFSTQQPLPSPNSPPTAVDRWSSVAIPQPLPLPDLCWIRTVASAASPFTSDQGHTLSRKGTTRSDRGLLRDVNREGVRYKLTLNFTARSALTSVLSSPTRSPQKSNTRDCFSTCMASREYPIGSPVKATHSSDHSPLRSPTARSPHLNSRCPNTIVAPESSCQANIVHPLPRPPGPNIHSFMEKPNVSSVKGQWQKGRLIGRGTFGSVYLATNRETGALCAMKEVDLIPDDPKSAECIKQLEQEIKVLHQLKHQNIVQFYGSEIIDDHFYIYLEYIYPGSINKYVRDHCGAITQCVVRNFTRHILSGLAFLHATKTIHRDIKGANLLVDSAGVVKLADFGMAKHLMGQYDLSLKGSPHWMAPEVIKAAIQKETNPNHAFGADIWSLGCTVIEMLNGKPPWSEFEGPQAMFKILNKSPPIPETLSSEGKDFLHCCFRRNPAERPSASKLLEHPFVQNVPVAFHASFSATN